MRNEQELSQDEFIEMIKAATDWRFLACSNDAGIKKMIGRYPSRSNLDFWLQKHFDIDQMAARAVSNAELDTPRAFIINDQRGVSWSEYNTHRAAPTLEKYPDFYHLLLQSEGKSNDLSTGEFGEIL